MKKNRKFISILLSVCMALSVFIFTPSTVSAKTQSTNIQLSIYAEGIYSNWDGVSNVSQFLYKGQYCFAYCKDKNIYVVKTKKGVPQGKQIVLKMKHPLFGGVTSDSEGNFYVVSGRNNNTDDTSVNTVFVSKYNKNGKLLKTVGDNGSSSLAYYYGSSYYTKEPFHAGNCDVTVNGNFLAVNYARKMYSGHQSNSVLILNLKNMKKVNAASIYESHSFAQRAIPYKDSFLFASEGDCYNRAFTIAYKAANSDNYTETPIFDFWVKKDTLLNYDMFTLNNNFAHMGGLAYIDKGLAALTGTSAKSLNEKAASENEQLFIQIFDPSKDLTKAAAYKTTGKRSGKAGPNGTDKVTNYGVLWLTNSNKYIYKNPQIVSNGKGKAAVLYEKYEKSTYAYKGVYYIVVNSSGKIKKKETCFSATAYLNPCRMPVYADGQVYWTGNRYGDSTHEMYIYSFTLK